MYNIIRNKISSRTLSGRSWLEYHFNHTVAGFYIVIS